MSVLKHDKTKLSFLIDGVENVVEMGLWLNEQWLDKQWSTFFKVLDFFVD